MPGAWRLQDVRIYDSGMNLVTHVDEITALAGIESARFTLAKVDPEERDFFSLKSAIGEMERAGRPTEAAEAGLWHNILAPLDLLMPSPAIATSGWRGRATC